MSRPTLPGFLAGVFAATLLVPVAGAQTACEPYLVPCSPDADPTGRVLRVDSPSSLRGALNRLDRRTRIIEIEPGTYKLTSLDLYASGSQASPLTIRAADPASPPILDFGQRRRIPGFRQPIDLAGEPDEVVMQPEVVSDDLSLGSPNNMPAVRRPPGGGIRNPGINVEGDWWLFDGLVIRNAMNGVFLIGSHLTLRNVTVESSYGEAVLVAQASRGYLHVDRCTIRRIGLAPERDHPQGRHGVYVSNGGMHATHHIRVLNSAFEDLSGAAVHLNGSLANQFNEIDWPKRPVDPVRFGISDVVIENNVILDTREGVNLYRFVFNTVIRRNTFVFTASAYLSIRSGQLLQIRNAAHNTIERNLFYSDNFRRNAIVGYRESGTAPRNGLNTLQNNAWCLDARARFSWDRPGDGVNAGLSLRDYARRTGDKSSTVATVEDSGTCSEITRALEYMPRNAHSLRRLGWAFPPSDPIGASPLRLP